MSNVNRITQKGSTWVPCDDEIEILSIYNNIEYAIDVEGFEREEIATSKEIREVELKYTHNEYSYKISMQEFWNLGLNKEFEMDRPQEVQVCKGFVHWYVNTSKYSNPRWNKFPKHLYWECDEIEVLIHPQGDKFDVGIKNSNLTHEELREFISELKRYNTLKDCKWAYGDNLIKINNLRGINLIKEDVGIKKRSKNWTIDDSKIPNTYGIAVFNDAYKDEKHHIRNMNMSELTNVINDSDVDNSLREYALNELKERAPSELKYQIGIMRNGLHYITNQDKSILKNKGYELKDINEISFELIDEFIEEIESLPYGWEVSKIIDTKFLPITKYYELGDCIDLVGDAFSLIDELKEQSERNRKYEEGEDLSEFVTKFDDFSWESSQTRKDEAERHDQYIQNKRRYKANSDLYTDNGDDLFPMQDKIRATIKYRASRIESNKKNKLKRLNEFHHKNVPKNIITITSQMTGGFMNPTTIIQNEIKGFEKRMEKRQEM